MRVAAALLVIASTAVCQPSGLQMERRFAELRRSPPELYAFLYRMPKGGDLHNHFEGAIYAEAFLKAAAEDHLCLDEAVGAIVVPPCIAPLVDARLAQTDNALRNAMINSLSMRNFVPGKE